MAGLAGHGWKAGRPETAGYDLKWLKMAGNGWKKQELLEMAENG